MAQTQIFGRTKSLESVGGRPLATAPIISRRRPRSKMRSNLKISSMTRNTSCNIYIVDSQIYPDGTDDAVPSIDEVLAVLKRVTRLVATNNKLLSASDWVKDQLSFKIFPQRVERFSNSEFRP